MIAMLKKTRGKNTFEQDTKKRRTKVRDTQKSKAPN